MEPHAAALAFSAWESFYVIVGSSSGALIGLQFVVITLLKDTGTRRTHDAVSAFATPTVVHFSCSLLIAALMSAPWAAASTLAACLAALGVCGIGYGLRVAHRAWRQSLYPPGVEDWAWYVVLPCIAYLALLVAAVAMRAGHSWGVELTAIVSVALLFIGIHNAWDTVTYIVVSGPDGAQEKAPNDA